MGFFSALGQAKPTEMIQDFQKNEKALAGMDQEQAFKKVQIAQEEIKLRDAQRKEEMRKTPLYLDHIEAMNKEKPNSQWAYIKNQFPDKFKTDPASKRPFITIEDAETIALGIAHNKGLMKGMFDARMGDHLKDVEEVVQQISKLTMKAQETGEPVDEEKMKALMATKKRLDGLTTDYSQIQVAMEKPELVMQDDRKRYESEAKMQLAEYKLAQNQTALELKAQQLEFREKYAQANLDNKIAMLQMQAGNLGIAYQRLAMDTKNKDFNHAMEAQKFILDNTKQHIISILKGKPLGSAGQQLMTGVQNSTNLGALNALITGDGKAFLEPHERQYVDDAIAANSVAIKSIQKQFGITTGIQVPAKDDLKTWQMFIDSYLTKGAQPSQVIGYMQNIYGISAQEAKTIFENMVKASQDQKLATKYGMKYNPPKGK